ncbi:MAG TPA: hypothetical protein VMB05_10395 [Solirubrobacteraceae bacterium]|nr:hypothetical protein [Solirubrobacteraceae bacterium]
MGCIAVLLGAYAAVPVAQARPRVKISFEGVGPLRWGMSLSTVERTLGVHYDCSRGAIPGVCACEQGPGATGIAFSGEGLIALFTNSPHAITTRGVSVGTSIPAMRRRYPRARLITGGLSGGLVTFYLARWHGRAIAFGVEHGRVNTIEAFAHDDRELISSELCA